MKNVVHHRDWEGLVSILAVHIFVTAVLLTSAPAQTEIVIHAFAGPRNDGSQPHAGLTFDAQGNLYGTTQYGGNNNGGTVYKIDPSGTETLLSSLDVTAIPTSGVVLDKAGVLWGTTGADGTAGVGTVYKVTSSGEQVVYNFTGKADGAYPSGLTVDGAGNFYGTTTAGGPGKSCGSSGCGVVFKLTPNGQETVLYSFTGGADGGEPHAGVVLDAKGDLYGTTGSGGAHNAGTVFRVTPKGNETVLYSFTGLSDGAGPRAALILVKSTLYGTTVAGGTAGAGTVFKVTLKGKETVLHSFTFGADGGAPTASLAISPQGSLYGTTPSGGNKNCQFGCGVVFKMTPAGKERVLYSFTGGSDGSIPLGNLVLDSAGNLYGTTQTGSGNTFYGTVFKLVP